MLITVYNDKELLAKKIDRYIEEGYRVFGEPLTLIYQDVDFKIEYVFYGQCLIRNIN